MNAITDFFASPEDNDPGFVRLTRNLLIFALIATLLSMVMLALTTQSSGRMLTILVLSVSAILELIALLRVTRGSLTMAKIVVPTALIFAVTTIALNVNSLHDISILGFPLILIVATLLQGNRMLVVTTPLALLAVALLGTLDMTGLSTSPVASTTSIDDILIGMSLLASSAAILYMLVRRSMANLARAEVHEQAQIEANRELKLLQVSLEQQVEERTTELTGRRQELELANQQIERRAAQLEAMAQVARAITSVRDLPELLPRITAVISEKFDFYHVGVFLVDEANEYAVLSATNSEGGRKMLDRKHRLRVGEEGIVGYVTSAGEPRVALDVGRDPVFFNNPDLPETHSELALPLRSEGRIVGALDVQSREAGAFSDQDVKMLSLLADQVSLAIENARLFEETRTALAEAEAVTRQFVREAWSRLPVEHHLLGYRYSGEGAAPLEKPIDLVTAPMTEKGTVRSLETGKVIVPITLRGETIGNLVVQAPVDGELSREQFDLIKAVAERVALSAENARLFEETMRRAERERMVSDITGKIRSMPDPQAMVQTAIDELRKALDATRVEIIPQAVTGAE